MSSKKITILPFFVDDFMEIWEADHSLLEIDANAHSLETSAPITDQHHIIMLSEIFIIIKNSSDGAAQKITSWLAH